VGIGAALGAASNNRRVVAVCRYDSQVVLARSLGIAAVLVDDYAALPPPAPHVIVAAPGLEALDAAYRLVQASGTIHLVGMDIDDPDWRTEAGGSYAYFRRELSLAHHYMYTLPALRTAVTLIQT